MNNFTATVNLCRKPEELELGGRSCMKLRCADNTFGKNAEPRYFDAIVNGNDVDVAKRLDTGDQIVISGTLVATSFKAKKGKNKGKTVASDQMPFARILQVTKSPTFFAAQPDDEGETENTEEPELEETEDAEIADGDDPLADLA